MKETLNLIVLRIWHELKCEEAQDLIEYALLCALVSASAVVVVQPVGAAILAYYTYILNAFGVAMGSM